MSGRPRLGGKAGGRPAFSVSQGGRSSVQMHACEVGRDPAERWEPVALPSCLFPARRGPGGSSDPPAQGRERRVPSRDSNSSREPQACASSCDSHVTVVQASRATSHHPTSVGPIYQLLAEKQAVHRVRFSPNPIPQSKHTVSFREKQLRKQDNPGKSLTPAIHHPLTHRGDVWLRRGREFRKAPGTLPRKSAPARSWKGGVAVPLGATQRW